MLWEISEGRRVKPTSEIYRPGDLLPYTLRGISRKYALLLGQCTILMKKVFQSSVINVKQPHGKLFEKVLTLLFNLQRQNIFKYTYIYIFLNIPTYVYFEYTYIMSYILYVSIF
jgi:hypothetical protein